MSNFYKSGWQVEHVKHQKTIYSGNIFIPWVRNKETHLIFSLLINFDPPLGGNVIKYWRFTHHMNDGSIIFCDIN